MSIFSKFLGTITHAEEAVRSGLAQAGITDESEIDATVTSFFAGDGKEKLKNAAFCFAIDKMKADGRIADWIDLGGGLVYLVDEYVDFEVDYDISVEEISRRSNLDSKSWEYLGKVPEGGTRKVKAAIGRLNRNWSEEWFEPFLTKPGSRLRGSGAWVREAYLNLRPDYDGKGWLAFPEPESSRWQSVHGGNVCFPGLWHDYDRRWSRGLLLVRREQGQSLRLCLLVE